jgi:PiT family inorganic phosphate transporter
MSAALVVVVVLALVFDFSNGFHDSSNAIAAPVATGAMRPGQAVSVSATFNLLGPLVAGTAVADTVGGIVTLGPAPTMTVLTCALTAALTWNMLTWWRRLPSSSSHALVGGLVGAGVATAGAHAINWGGLHGLRPVGVIGILAGLAISPLLGAFVGWLAELGARRGLRRARRRLERPILRGEWVTAAALAFANGSNDAQKTMGVIATALVASGTVGSFTVPLWVKIACAAALTVGSAVGGWRIVRTIGRGIFRIRPLDGLVSQGSSAGVIGVAAFLGAPVSTTHVVASSVVGVGAARRRRHVRWPVVREILLAWIVTMPACAGMAGIVAGAWRIAS